MNEWADKWIKYEYKKMKTQKTSCNKGEALTVAVRKFFKQHSLLVFFVDNKYFNKVYVYMCVYIHGWHDGFNAVSEESLEPPQDRGECVQ